MLRLSGFQHQHCPIMFYSGEKNSCLSLAALLKSTMPRSGCKAWKKTGTCLAPMLYMPNPTNFAGWQWNLSQCYFGLSQLTHFCCCWSWCLPENWAVKEHMAGTPGSFENTCFLQYFLNREQDGTGWCKTLGLQCLSRPARGTPAVFMPGVNVAGMCEPVNPNTSQHYECEARCNSSCHKVGFLIAPASRTCGLLTNCGCIIDGGWLVAGFRQNNRLRKLLRGFMLVRACPIQHVRI